MVEVFRSPADLVAALARPKKLVTPCSWVAPGANGQRGFRLKATLRDDVASIRGLSLEIGCNVEGFELPVSVVLLAEFKGRPQAMARIDINGSRHENRHAACGDWQFIDAGTTHFHDTHLHTEMEIDQIFFLNLPVARPIRDMPSGFLGAMEKCGKLLHIQNLNEVEEPQWQPKRLL